jgi:hypothetical protein
MRTPYRVNPVKTLQGPGLIGVVFLATALVSLGCGQTAVDLFAVERTTASDKKTLRMVISDAGTVTCDSATPVSLGGPRLLKARQLARDIEPHAKLDIALPPRQGHIYIYRIRHAAGSVGFADNSAALPHALAEVVALSHDVAKSICSN